MSLKLYLDLAATRSWAESVAEVASGCDAIRTGAVSLFVLPSFPAIDLVSRAFSGTRVRVGAQDLHWADRGPFTGAVSGTDLYDAGCRYVEVGHAERRRLFAEDDEVVRRKLAAAVRNRLTPVLCIGEPDRSSPQQAARECLAQLDSALAGVGPDTGKTNLIVAYEPEWAIGQPAAAPAEHIRVVTAALRERLADVHWVARPCVIYGGSAQHGLLSALGGSVDGLFLGRFAHDPRDLVRIVEEASTLA